MKLHYLLVSISVFSQLRAEDITTLDGKVYKNVKVTRADVNGITALHSDGITKIPLSNLPSELKAKYSFVETPKQETANANEQKWKIGGFLGIPWLTNSANAKSIMLKREGFKISEKEARPELQIYVGEQFSEMPIQTVSLSFLDDKFYSGQIIFKTEVSPQSTFDRILEKLQKKYGDDGVFERQFADWHFPDEKSKTESISCFLSIEQGLVTASYEYVPLSEEAKKRKSELLSTKDL